VIPGTLTSHEVSLTWARHVSKGGKSGIVGEPEKLMKEGDIVIPRDYLRGARRTTATRRPRTAGQTSKLHLEFTAQTPKSLLDIVSLAGFRVCLFHVGACGVTSL
jgi:hypothetical protein